MLKRTLLTLTLLCLLTDVLLAADDPFVGRWMLNPGKSNLAGEQLKIEDLGGNKYKITSGNVSNVITADGTDQPDQFGTTTSIAPEGSNAWKMVVKRDCKVVQSMILALSPDGTIQTVKGTNIRPDGSTSDFEVELKRISRGSGWAGTWEEVKEKETSSHELDIETYEGRGLTFKSTGFRNAVNVNFDGKDYEEVGPDRPSGGAFSGKRVDDRSLELTFKMKGQIIENRTYQVSPDGKTLTITTHESGQPHAQVRVYDKL